MSDVEKIGGIAAFVNAAASAITLVVAFGLMGLPTLTDRRKLVELAINNPTPLIIQDALKLVSAAIAVVLITALFNRLKSDAPKPMRVAAATSYLAVLCLVINAGLSFFSVSQVANNELMTSNRANHLIGVIGLLGIAVTFLNGVWYILISWSALKLNRLPKPLSYLGLGMGLLSLLPPLGILVLLFSVVWSLWLGQVLLKSEGASCGRHKSNHCAIVLQTRWNLYSLNKYT